MGVPEYRRGGGLVEIMAWSEIARRERYEAHAMKNIELWTLPTRGYTLHRMPPLSVGEKRELSNYRRAEKANPSEKRTLTDG